MGQQQNRMIYQDSYNSMPILGSQMTFQDSQYTVLKDIGIGSFGDVKLIEDKHKVKYALKIISQKKLKKIPVHYIQSEIKIMQQLDHDNILKLIDYYVEYDGSYFIILEYCEGGDLLTFLKKLKNERKFNQDNILRIFYQIILGFKVLHSNHIIHREQLKLILKQLFIKPENILIKNGQPKIADFGFSKNIQKECDIAQTCLGSLPTMAPEIILGQKYSYEVDIYSLGVLLYFMLFLKYPYDSKSQYAIVQLIQQENTAFSNTSQIKVDEDVKNLIMWMIKFDKKERPTITELKESAIFKKYSLEFDHIMKKPSMISFDCIQKVDEFNKFIELQQQSIIDLNNQFQENENFEKQSNPNNEIYNNPINTMDENIQQQDIDKYDPSEQKNESRPRQLKKIMTINVDKFVQYLKRFEDNDESMISSFIRIYDGKLSDHQNQEIENKMVELNYNLNRCSQYFLMLYQIANMLKQIEQYDKLYYEEVFAFSKDQISKLKKRVLCYFQVKIERIQKQLENAENQAILKYDQDLKQKYEQINNEIQKWNKEQYYDKSKISDIYKQENEQQQSNKLIQSCQFFNSLLQMKSDSTKNIDLIDKNLRLQVILSNLILLFNNSINIDNLNFNAFNLIISRKLEYGSLLDFIQFEKIYI